MIKRFTSVVVLFIATIMLFSCNLEDFKLNKLADPRDIIPEAFAPLVYGTFNANDLLISPPADNFQLPPGGLTLDPYLLDKTGTSFRSAAVDSVYLITHFTNETPAEMEFELFFIDNTTGVTLSGPYNSGRIPANSVKDFLCIPIKLGPLDQDKIDNSTQIKLNYTLFSPAGGAPVTYADVKDRKFTVDMAFYAPVKLWKLK